MGSGRGEYAVCCEILLSTISRADCHDEVRSFEKERSMRMRACVLLTLNIMFVVFTFHVFFERGEEKLGGALDWSLVYDSSHTLFFSPANLGC